MSAVFCSSTTRPSTPREGITSSISTGCFLSAYLRTVLNSSRSRSFLASTHTCSRRLIRTCRLRCGMLWPLTVSLGLTWHFTLRTVSWKQCAIFRSWPARTECGAMHLNPFRRSQGNKLANCFCQVNSSGTSSFRNFIFSGLFLPRGCSRLR